MNNKICVFPGSFYPITKGHEDIINRALTLFDEVRVLIAVNPDKHDDKLSERAEIIRKLYRGTLVKTDIYKGLTAEYCKANGIKFIVRGVRNSLDYCYEYDLAQINKSMGIETILFFTSYSYISSGHVRELLKYDGDISQYVPASIMEEIKILFNK